MPLILFESNLRDSSRLLEDYMSTMQKFPRAIAIATCLLVEDCAAFALVDKIAKAQNFKTF